MTAPRPSDLSPRDARDRFLNERRIDSTDPTIRSYRNRLTRFAEWCEENGIETVADLDGWTLDEYRRSLTEDSPATVKGKMMAVKQLIGYLERIEAVPEDFEEKVPIPTLTAEDERCEKKLAPEDGKRLITAYRDSSAWYATPRHAFLEVLWFTGCRLGSARALDLDDFEPEAGVLRFRNQPDSGTRLKKGAQGERPVAIPSGVVDVLEAYIERERFDKRDDHGRRPLFACRQGRPSNTTLRAWAYLATQPCVYRRCPHDRHHERCDYRKRTHASKCPSSRSPHQVRTGSITWQLNTGMPIEDVAERVNSSPDVLRRHYDVASGEEKLEERRREYIPNLSLSEDE